MEVMVEKVANRRLWAVCSVLLFALGLLGCTTNITPPSGPVGTEVCFSPAPFTWFGTDGGMEYELFLCPWHVTLTLHRDGSYLHYIPTDGQCFNIPASTEYPTPSVVSAGDEFTVEVYGAMGFACEPWFQGSLLSLYGHFVVTE